MARTIYFFGGEDTDLTPFGTTAIDTTAGHFRSTMARCALQGADGDSGWATGDVTGGVASCWFHSRVWMTASSPNTATGVSNAARASIDITDALGFPRLVIYFSGSFASSPGNQTPSLYSLAKADAAFNLTNLATFTAFFTGSPAAPDQLDIQVANYATPGAGVVNVYINNTLACAVTGASLATDSNTTINGWRLGGGGAPALAAPNKWPISYSEIIVSDQDTRNLSLARLTPSADGNTVNWDVGGASNINEQTVNDLTLNSSGTAGQVQQYTVTAPPSGNYGVVGVGFSARAQQGSFGGPAHLQFGTRVGGTDYFDTPGSALSPTLGTVQKFLTTKPGTGSAFTASELAAAGFNVGMRSAT